MSHNFEAISTSYIKQLIVLLRFPEIPQILEISAGMVERSYHRLQCGRRQGQTRQNHQRRSSASLTNQFCQSRQYCDITSKLRSPYPQQHLCCTSKRYHASPVNIASSSSSHNNWQAFMMTTQPTPCMRLPEAIAPTWAT